MKYVIVIPDGASDEPQESLGGKTPFQAAKTPNLDRLASIGFVGRVNHTPVEFPPGSDVANLSLLGYDPLQYFSGRAALEAAAQKIPLEDRDWVVRCNLVTIEKQTMRDFTAGHVTTAEATELLNHAQSQLPNGCPIQFVPGVSYRNLMVCRSATDGPSPFSRDTRTTPPHDLMDKPVIDDFPRGPGSQILSDLMSHSVDWFANHPVNQQRISSGKLPVTNLWLWGLGQRPKLEPFQARHHLRGVMIAAVDLLRGLAELIGWANLEVAGATGYLDTDYAAKGAAAVRALDEFDLVCVHIEAPDEASHQGNVAAKVASIESIDRDIIGPIVKKLEACGDWRILVSPDHPTLLSTKTHCHGDVPFVMAGKGIPSGRISEYSETTAANNPLATLPGHHLMHKFIIGRI